MSINNYDPYAGPPKGSPGVVPSKDYNYPTPNPNVDDPMEKPGFLREAYEELIKVRKEIDMLYAEEMGARNKGFMSAGPSMYSSASLSVSAMERKADYDARMCKLEEREAALVASCAEFKKVASLGDAGATEDESGEPANAAKSGAVSRVGRR